MARTSLFLSQLIIVLLTSFAAAVPPSESLLPSTTKGYVSVPSVEQLRVHWNDTQFGRMVEDPMMKPFVEDLREQLEGKLSSTRVRLGLTIDDLKGIYGGELCMAAVQPGNKPAEQATVLLVDVTGHVDQAAETINKARRNLVAQGATERTAKLDGVQVTIVTMPKQREDRLQIEACLVIHKDVLIAVDHLEVCKQILARLNRQPGETLADVEAFQATLNRCRQDAGGSVPDIRWFVEPFGYAQTVRAAGGGRKRKGGADLLKVLPNQGFDAIKGIGGFITFATGDEDIVHRTMVFAPPVKAVSGTDSRYRLAARMLDFPNSESLQPEPFVFRDLGTYLTFKWNMINAFEYSKTLVNEVLGGGEKDDLMEEIIIGLAEDKDGPQVDLRKDLIAHFGDRASLVSDCRRPVTPDSERLMVAIELTNPEAVRAALDKAFSVDPDAEKREFEGHIIWEIIKDNAPAEVDDIQIEGDMGIFDPFGEEAAADESEVAAEEKILPNSAITVANGHLIVATHVDIIVEMLQRPLGTELLSEAADYQLVQDALAKLGAGPSSFRFFARTDESYRPTYELIRQGKMPEAKTVLGKLLNRMMGPDEKGILREQQIDGSKMPEFDAVRRYLGPAGMYVQSEENGWFMAGCLLSKEMR